MTDIREKERQVDQIIRSLGTYTDVARTKADVNFVLRQVPYLQPRNEVLTRNNGTTSNMLCLSGTIPTTFMGTTYQTPVKIWVVEQYPATPPIAYVTPTADMMIKPGHKHCDFSGMVYLPYLHEWSARSSSLIELIGNMSSVFSAMPPLFKKPAGGVTSTSTPRTSPPAYTRDSTTTSPSRPPVREPDHKAEVTSALQSLIYKFYKTTTEELEAEATQQSHLESRQKSLTEGIEGLHAHKAQLEAYASALERGCTELTAWLAANETRPADETSDSVVCAKNVLSEQLLNSVAESCALEDALYHIDHLFQEGKLPLDDFLKEVRSLARRQFLAKASAQKISLALARYRAT